MTVNSSTATLLFAAKKMKDSLSSFLPHMPGMVDTPGDQDNSSLRGIIDKPPGRLHERNLQRGR
jgi:hypothetical protein